MTKYEIPVGGGYRYLTVTSPEGHTDVELMLEPNAKTFQEAMFKQGIPLNAFEVADIAAEIAPPEIPRRRLHDRPDPGRPRQNRRLLGHGGEPDPDLPATILAEDDIAGVCIIGRR